MQKCNEDPNTTLIFAGLFSAGSSAFVIDVQSKLEPDSAERSETYLQAILLILNQSISPNKDSTVPPAQLKAVKKFLDAWMSLNMKKAEPVLSNDFQFESLPECTDLPKQTKESYLRMWGGGVFPGKKSWSA